MYLVAWTRFPKLCIKPSSVMATGGGGRIKMGASGMWWAITRRLAAMVAGKNTSSKGTSANAYWAEPCGCDSFVFFCLWLTGTRSKLDHNTKHTILNRRTFLLRRKVMYRIVRGSVPCPCTVAPFQISSVLRKSPPRTELRAQLHWIHGDHEKKGLLSNDVRPCMASTVRGR